MTWQVVDPARLASHGSKIVAMDISAFPDRIDYEDILGRHLDRPSDRDFLASGGLVILATKPAFAEVRRLADRAYLLRQEGLISELRRLGMERQIVALEWRREGLT